MAAVRYTFSLDAVQDADLVRWLELQPNTSAAVRDALKAHLERPTLADLGGKLDRVLDALRGVKVLQAGAVDGDQGEPARARANLDALKDRFRR